MGKKEDAVSKLLDQVCEAMPLTETEIQKGTQFEAERDRVRILSYIRGFVYPSDMMQMALCLCDILLL